jgi:hypothetical protein
MAIDIHAEHTVSLREACELLPRRRAGKKPAIETLYRWSLRGCRGVRLETVQIGGTRCTSREALQRFFDALTERADGANSATLPPTGCKQRLRELAAAENYCKAAGI